MRTQREKPSLSTPQLYNPPSEEKHGFKQPPNLRTRQFRKLGDLSEAEQRSIVALINKEDPVVRTKTLIVTAIVCDTHAPTAEDIHKQSAGTSSSGDLQATQLEEKKTQRRKKLRASSLPDVLEEDLITSIS